MEHLRGEVAAESAPRGAIGGGADVVLVAGDEFGGREGLGAVGEEGAVVDEGAVGEGTVGDEDGGAGADAEGDDGAVLGVEAPEDGLEFREGFAEPEEARDDGDVSRARRDGDGGGGGG